MSLPNSCKVEVFKPDIQKPDTYEGSTFHVDVNEQGMLTVNWVYSEKFVLYPPGRWYRVIGQ